MEKFGTREKEELQALGVLMQSQERFWQQPVGLGGKGFQGEGLEEILPGFFCLGDAFLEIKSGNNQNQPLQGFSWGLGALNNLPDKMRHIKCIQNPEMFLSLASPGALRFPGDSQGSGKRRNQSGIIPCPADSQH